MTENATQQGKKGDGGQTTRRRKIPTRVTYLEMTNPPPARALDPLHSGFHLKKVPNPSVRFYRELYDRVGVNYTWTARKLLSDKALRAIIQDPRVELHVLWKGDRPIGFIELDLRLQGEVEIAYFGIVPEVQRQGLGRYLLAWSILYVWREKQPKRYWLHTCTLDHPAALSLYEKVGFRKYKTKNETVDLLS